MLMIPGWRLGKGVGGREDERKEEEQSLKYISRANASAITKGIFACRPHLLHKVEKIIACSSIDV